MDLNARLSNTSAIKNGRLPWIDYARGIAIFLVLYRHIFYGIKMSGIDVSHYQALQEGNIMFFSFRMPLFFIVSGAFLGSSLVKRGLARFIDNKWNLLLYPYFLWAVITVTLQIILSRYVNAGRTGWDYLYILYKPREIDQFWYLYALFNTSVLYAFNRSVLRIRGLYQLAIGVAFFYFSGMLVRRGIHIGFLYDIVHYYIFIAIGDTIAGFLMDKKNVALFSSWKAFFLILPVFAVAQWYFLQTNMAHASLYGKADYYSYVEDWQPLLFLVIALSGCFFMMNVSFLLQRYNAFLLLRIIGYHSLYIYLLHVLASSTTRIVLTRGFGVTNVPVLFCCGVAAGLTAPIVFYTLAMRMGGWWLFTLERPEKKKVKPPVKSEQLAVGGLGQTADL